MIEMITGWLDLLSPFWPWLKAISLALLFSWGLTQLLKYCWRVVKGTMLYAPDDEVEKLVLRILATVLCFIPLYQLWPDPDDAVWWSLVTSLLSPAGYKVVTYWLYSKFPFMEKALSANPPIVIRRDEDGRIIGIKEGNDKTQIIRPQDKTERLNRD